MSIDPKEVRHIAKLSRLALSNEDEALFGSQLGRILTYVKQLDQLDTEGVKPTSHVINDLKNVSRTDTNRKSLSTGEALANAPDRADGLFRVPRIIQ